MINPTNHVIIYLNGRPVNFGTAGCTRGFLEDKITIICLGQRFEADRKTGDCGDGYNCVPYGVEEWHRISEKIKATAYQEWLEKEQQAQKAELARQLLEIEAGKWFDTLDQKHQDYVAALSGRWMPIAVA